LMIRACAKPEVFVLNDTKESEAGRVKAIRSASGSELSHFQVNNFG